jgi:hypothetical protein
MEFYIKIRFLHSDIRKCQSFFVLRYDFLLDTEQLSLLWVNASCCVVNISGTASVV